MTHEVKSQKLVEFSRIITFDDRDTVVTNGIISQFKFPNVHFPPSVEEIETMSKFLNLILDAVKVTKRQYNKYQHDHRSEEEKTSRHVFVEGDTSPACALCGLAPEAKCHYKRS